jgi:hypothetical protein
MTGKQRKYNREELIGFLMSEDLIISRRRLNYIESLAEDRSSESIE